MMNLMENMRNVLAGCFFCCAIACPMAGARAQTLDKHTAVTDGQKNAAVIEIRSYTLRPGTRDAFHRLVVEQSLPMLQRWKIDVLGYGPSLQEDSSYYLIRVYPSLEERQRQEDAFYGSTEWRQGPRAAILAPIINYTTVILPVDNILQLSSKIETMLTSNRFAVDSAELSALNKQFIENFIHQDVVRHDAIIHPDFVCIGSDGTIVGREEYLKGWATGYERSGYVSFAYTDEVIRIFGNMALVRSKTVYTKMVDGKTVKGNTVYTDTYVKEEGVWTCVQAQLTPVK
jgi:hypothetical protein